LTLDYFKFIINVQTIINTYELLPPLFEGIDDDQTEQFLMKRNIQEGGAAIVLTHKMAGHKLVVFMELLTAKLNDNEYLLVNNINMILINMKSNRL
jgi:hypothetical protein